MIRTPPKQGGKVAKRTKYATNKPYPKKATTYRKSRIPNAISMGKDAFPMRLQNTLKYSTTADITYDALQVAYFGIRANGLFDPEIPLGGHQPLYFGTLTSVYNHWCVTRSKFTVRCAPLTGGISGSLPTLITLFIDDDQTWLTNNPTRVRETPGACSHILAPQEADKAHSIYWNGQKTFGGNLIDNPELKGNAGADPTEQSTFWVHSFGGQTDQDIRFYIDVEYTVVWDELKTIPPS